MTIRPTTSVATRKIDSRPRVLPTSPRLREPVMAMPESSAIMAMARMSSMMRIPKISWAKGSFDLPSSANALTMMVVEEIDSIAPRNRLSMELHPKAWPIW